MLGTIGMLVLLAGTQGTALQVDKAKATVKTVQQARSDWRKAVIAEHIGWLEEDPKNGSRSERILAGVETCESDAECAAVFGIAY